MSSRHYNMDLHESSSLSPEPKGDGRALDSFYDSFRWLDEEEDLDLRLFLDGCHAKLTDDLPLPTNERRPSFRRHLSITKLSFGRPSLSSSRPVTKDAMIPTSPSSALAGTPQDAFGQARRKSRALSLITSKHAIHESITAFDPSAAHYQDPEARLKLRVYLASLQKFDEAIEFGFPSNDVLPASPVLGKGSPKLNHRRSQQILSADSTYLRTFLDDEDDDEDEDDGKNSLDSQQPSLTDSEPPITPQTMENKQAVRPVLISSQSGYSRLPILDAKALDGGYPQTPTVSREMTLRMTLTRPDLRVGDEQIYGRQSPGPYSSRKSMGSLLGRELARDVAYVGGAARRGNRLAGGDHWNATTTDGGVVKRFWKRVRRV